MPGSHGKALGFLKQFGDFGALLSGRMEPPRLSFSRHQCACPLSLSPGRGAAGKSTQPRGEGPSTPNVPVSPSMEPLAGQELLTHCAVCRGRASLRRDSSTWHVPRTKHKAEASARPDPDSSCHPQGALRVSLMKVTKGDSPLGTRTAPWSRGSGGDGAPKGLILHGREVPTTLNQPPVLNHPPTLNQPSPLNHSTTLNQLKQGTGPLQHTGSTGRGNLGPVPAPKPHRS